MSIIQKQTLQRGVVHLLASLLVVLAIASIISAGWYVHNHNTLHDNANKRQDNAAQKFIVEANNPVKANAFYDCWSKLKHLDTEHAPFTCTQGNVIYKPPTVFYAETIKDFNKVPAAAKSLVTKVAQDNFEGCTNDPSGFNIPYRPSVTIAQSNYVAMGIFCDSGSGYFFGLDNGVWSQKGHGQMGLGCEDVDKYHITQSAIVGDIDESTNNCFYSDGSQKQLPVK